MGRGHSPREDLPPLRATRSTPGRIPTLGELRPTTCWLWIYCKACGRKQPIALTPYIIRWGAGASSDVLRNSMRCRDCGAKGITTINPSWIDKQIGFAPFPAERTEKIRPPRDPQRG